MTIPALHPPPPDVPIRPVRLTDADALYAACFGDRSRQWVTSLLEWARRIALQERGLGVVALCADGLPIAYGQLTVWMRYAEISDLIVKEAERGRGIGTAIIQYLIRAARESGMAHAEIGVDVTNPRALALYKRLGFTESRMLNIERDEMTQTIQYLTVDL